MLPPASWQPRARYHRATQRSVSSPGRRMSPFYSILRVRDLEQGRAELHAARLRPRLALRGVGHSEQAE
jgi:hypothetical protein